MAGQIGWAKLAKDVMGGGMGIADPSFVFDWPLARVLVLFFADAAAGCHEITAEQAHEILKRKRQQREADRG